MACIEKNVKGVALVVDGERRLLGTVTDGDIRRAILGGVSLERPVSELLERKRQSAYPTPVTAPVGDDEMALLRLMRDRSIRQVPLIDAEGRVADLVTLDELVPEK